jgi:hypothetical protein
MGREVNVVAGYFPISDSLLDHIDKIDAYKDGNDRVNKSVADKMQMKELREELDFRNEMWDATAERYRRLLGIPFKSLNGKIFAGSEGPGTKGLR